MTSLRAQVALALVSVSAATAAAVVSAQQYPKTSVIVPYTPASGKCLTPDQQKVNAAYNSLSRPTQPGDDMPFWDPEYFVGSWDMDMRTQDSPLGAGGQSVGTLTMKASAQDKCGYEGTLTGEDPDGKAFTRTITAVYDPEKKVLTWTEKDSRGYTLVEEGPIGGELGGLFHHHFGEGASVPAVTIDGKAARFKGVSEMSSPAYFKKDLQLSVDNAPFKTFGRALFEKQLPPDK